MRKFLILTSLIFISLSVCSQNVIKRNTSKDQHSSSSTSSSARTTVRQSGNSLTIGKYSSLKGYHTITLDDGTKYEGTFNNGTITGTVTYPDGMKLEGYFEKGELEGQGRIYENGTLSFDGVFSRGLPNGAGTLYLEGQAIYSNNWHDEFCAENVTFKMSESETFVGDFKGRFPYNGKIYSNQGVSRFWFDENEQKYKSEPIN